ncbi:MAG: energy transducer TonB [Pseudomonadota bacterium]
MKARTIIRATALTAIAAWIASATLAQSDNRVLARAFPAKLLVSKASCTTPEWPMEARRYEIEGVTLLHFHIGDDGGIDGAKVAGTSSWKLLDEAALRSLVQCKFKPGLAAERDATYTIQFVWTLSGPPSARPQLVEDSCAPSARFSKFQPYNRNATARDGVLLRFLVNPKGEPIGVKAEADGAFQEAGAAAAEYVKRCRFALDPAMPGEKTDTVFGRVLSINK